MEALWSGPQTVYVDRTDYEGMRLANEKAEWATKALEEAQQKSKAEAERAWCLLRPHPCGQDRQPLRGLAADRPGPQGRVWRHRR
jgi:hypothetical protein